MSSNEWGILIAAAVAVAGPNVVAWACVYARLGVLAERIRSSDRDLHRLQKSTIAIGRRTRRHAERLEAIEQALPAGASAK